MSVETYTIEGASRLSELVSRVRHADPDCVVELVDLGQSRYEVKVTASPDKSAPALEVT